MKPYIKSNQEKEITLWVTNKKTYPNDKSIKIIKQIWSLYVYYMSIVGKKKRTTKESMRQ